MLDPRFRTAPVDNSERVPFRNSCPECGERRADFLVWQNDGETVECATCGYKYNPNA